LGRVAGEVLKGVVEGGGDEVLKEDEGVGLAFDHGVEGGDDGIEGFEEVLVGVDGLAEVALGLLRRSALSRLASGIKTLSGRRARGCRCGAAP
jgi:hypothetical protein